MCEIITICAAVAFTAIYFISKKKGNAKKSVFTTMLMFWGAALMWAVDGIASVAEGEGFFDISMEDTILGCIILASGLAIFGVLALLEKRKAVKASE